MTMAISQEAQRNHDELFPDHKSTLKRHRGTQDLYAPRGHQLLLA
jgi:hypothetical protein